MLALALGSRLSPRGDSKELEVAVALEGVMLRHRPDPPGTPWYSQLLALLALEDEPVLGYVAPTPLTQLHLHLQRCALDYRPAPLALRVLLTAETLSLTCGSGPEPRPGALRLLVDDGSVFLSERCGGAALDLQRDFVSVLDVDFLELLLSTGRGGDGEGGAAPPEELLVAPARLRGRTCADSAAALARLLQHLGTPPRAPPGPPPGEGPAPRPGAPGERPPGRAEPPPGGEQVGLGGPPPAPINQQDLTDALRDPPGDPPGDPRTPAQAPAPPRPPPVSLYLFPGEGGGSARAPPAAPEPPRGGGADPDPDPDPEGFCVLEAPETPETAAPRLRWLAPGPLRLRPGHFGVPRGGAGPGCAPPPGLPPPRARLVLRDLSLTWALYGGAGLRPRPAQVGHARGRGRGHAPGWDTPVGGAHGDTPPGRGWGTHPWVGLMGTCPRVGHAHGAGCGHLLGHTPKQGGAQVGVAVEWTHPRPQGWGWWVCAVGVAGRNSGCVRTDPASAGPAPAPQAPPPPRWRCRGGPGRVPEQLMELHLGKVCFQHETYAAEPGGAAGGGAGGRAGPGEAPTSRLVLLVPELELRDRLGGGRRAPLPLPPPPGPGRPPQPPTLWVKALRVLPQPPPPGGVPECCLRVTLTPLRLHVDQDALIFLRDFAGAFLAHLSPPPGPPPGPPPAPPGLGDPPQSEPPRTRTPKRRRPRSTSASSASRPMSPSGWITAASASPWSRLRGLGRVVSYRCRVAPGHPVSPNCRGCWGGWHPCTRCCGSGALSGTCCCCRCWGGGPGGVARGGDPRCHRARGRLGQRRAGAGDEAAAGAAGSGRGLYGLVAPPGPPRLLAAPPEPRGQRHQRLPVRTSRDQYGQRRGDSQLGSGGPSRPPARGAAPPPPRDWGGPTPAATPPQ
ncbi:autophagy-related protein 2 homolog A [Vidua macroura]|uniref:autophagy-related protein 2 homolog A n=1 Tax=Vidua macroura TaxID=187451 RepID=UPI0023A83F12|nr:autophagy-related protein 2 homolog A [Vidua macroura]